VTVFDKDPGALLDYRVSWADWLADGETIASSVFTAEDGITIAASSNTNEVGTVWLNGGTEGRTYKVTHEVTTSDARVDRRRFIVVVKER